MTDTAPVTDAPAEAAPVTEDAPATDTFDDAAVDTFDRAYVTKLRQESAGYRTKHKPYEEAFGKYSEDERAVWFELAAGLVNDPQTTAKRFQEIAAAVLGEGEKPPDPVANDSADEDEAPLTRKQVQELMAERDRTADLDGRVSRIKATAVGLGYKEGSVGYRTLLITAQENGGDIDAAHKLLEGERQSHIDAYIAAKKADAEGAPATGGTGSTAGQERSITTWAQASDALRERMAAG